MRFAKVAVVTWAVLTATFAFVPAAAADSAPCGRQLGMGQRGVFRGGGNDEPDAGLRSCF